MNNQEAERIFIAWKRFHQQGLSPEAVNSFYRFLGSWMMFNAIYNEQDQVTGSITNNSERARVESFADANALGAAHTTLLNNNESYAAAVTFIVRRNQPKPQWISVPEESTIKVWNLDHGRAGNILNHGHCEGAQDLKGLLGCLYVARCNLIHGDKEPGLAVDIDLCQNAFVILSNLLLNYTVK